jgi:hypothetical protein
MRRAAFTFDSWFKGHAYTATVDDINNPRELFINAGKAGQEIEEMLREFGTVASLALQYGTPIETIQHTTPRDSEGRPSTIAGAVIDQLVRMAA